MARSENIFFILQLSNWNNKMPKNKLNLILIAFDRIAKRFFFVVYCLHNNMARSNAHWMTCSKHINNNDIDIDINKTNSQEEIAFISRTS